MKFDLTLGLVDRPGQLLRALEPIAKNGGNIISILHEREKITGGYVPVSLVVDFPTTKNFEKTKRDLANIGIPVIKSREVIEKSTITLILIGELDTGKISEIETEGARILDFEASAPTSKEACTRLTIEAPAEAINKILKRLKGIAKEEKAVLISSV